MTREEFDKLGREWHAIEYELDCNTELSGEDRQRAYERIIEVERLMDAGEWDYDEDGNVVPRAS